MKKHITFLLALNIVSGSFLFAQDKFEKTRSIELIENDRKITFQIIWHNNTQSNVNFPPYQFKNSRFKQQWVQIVKDEIMGNPDAFQTGWSYNLDILLPNADDYRNDDVPEAGGDILGDVMNLLKGDKLVQQDGKVCINGFVDWTQVNLGFDETSLVPANYDTGQEERRRAREEEKEKLIEEEKLRQIKKARAGTTQTTPLKNGGSHIKTYDMDGDLESDIIIGPTKKTLNSDGSITEETNIVSREFDKNGKVTSSFKSSDKTTTYLDGSMKTKTKTEHYEGGKLKKKTESIDELDENGNEASSGFTVEYDAQDNPIKSKYSMEAFDGGFINIEFDSKTKEFTYSYGNKKKGISGSLYMTTDGNTSGTNVALCYPVEMINLMLNWNKLGAAVTDPSPIDDEEIMSETLDTAPIDPPRYEIGWTPSVKYLNLIEGGGVTDPPKHRDE